jgi:glutamate/tyrosine decarboxylase-like PLP-dependent enzyme
MKIPDKGQKPEQVIENMQRMRDGDADWKSGRTWSLVYHAGEEHTKLIKDAYCMYFSENGLSPLAFPSLKRFETEVIAMAADMLGGSEEAVGSLTSGGTESILMAVKSAREKARAERPEITKPEMVIPETAHPAFEKAAYYLDVKAVHVPVGGDFRADVEATRGAITGNTILIVGSAPSFPQGVVDPIPELAAIAKEKGIPCHVDACLGGFMLPWLRKLGYPVPDFDFTVDGVTSISADIHKYGFAAKGASCILYRDDTLRKYQYFAYADWCGGIYVSPSMTGTRPGGAIAAAWATLQHFGQEGYLALVKNIMEITEKLKTGIAEIPGVRILGDPVMGVFAFDLEKGNVFVLGDEMEQRGWHLDRVQSPPALHVMVTPPHAKVVEPFLQDLRETSAEVSAREDDGVAGMAAVYGMVAALPDPSQAKEFAVDFLNQLMRPGP